MKNNVINFEAYKATRKDGVKTRKKEIADIFAEARKLSLEPITQNTFGEGWEPDEINYFKLNNGEELKGYLVNSWLVAFDDIEVAFVRVEKQIFIAETGQLMVFYYMEQYTEDSNDDLFVYKTSRELAADQSLTENEYQSVVNKLASLFNKDPLFKNTI